MKSIYEFLLEYSDKVKKQLKDKFKLENDNLTDTIIDYYIAQFDKLKASPKIINKDITKYSFSELENLIDSIAVVDKSRVGVEKIDIKPIYNKNNIIVYEAPDKNSCIKLGKGEKWCISRNDASNMYNTYRYKMNEPNFYFIKNLNKPDSDKWSYYVLMVFNNKKYGLASRDNSDDFTGSEEYDWSEVIRVLPELASLHKLFKSKPLTEQEREIYNKVKNKVDSPDLLKYFNSLSLVEQYIGMEHGLTHKQFANLNNKELQNKYINTGNVLYSLDNLSQSQIDRYFTVNMQLNYGALDLSKLTSLPDNIKFPDKIGGELNSLDLSKLTSLPDNIKFPKEISGTLYLDNLISLPDNIKFPDYIGGNLKLTRITKLPNNIKFPNEIGGVLNLYSLTKLPNNIKFPDKIDGSLNLFNLTKLPDNIKFPKETSDTLYLDNLTEIPQSVLDNMSEQVKSKVRPQSLITK